MNKSELQERLRGVVPVLFCPYQDDGELDLAGLAGNTRFLVDYALKNQKPMLLLTNASTTECYANSLEEQKKVIKTVAETVAGRLPVIAGVSQAGTGLTVEMAQYAEAAGVDCVMVISPYYHHASRQGLYRHFREVAGSVNIGVMVYNNPAIAAAVLPADFLAELTEIDNIIACKDNAPNFSDMYQKSLTIAPEDMALFAGQGEVQFIAAAAYGYKYRGFVSYIANFAPGLSFEIYDSVMDRDFDKAYEALKKQAPLGRFVAGVEQKRASFSVIPGGLKGNYAYMSAGKAAMELAGLAGGRLRLPMEDLTAAEKQELRQVLRDIGVIR